MGRKPDLVLLTYETGITKTLAQYEARKLLSLSAKALSAAMSDPDPTHTFTVRGQEVKPSRISTGGAKPAVVKQRRANVGQHAWRFKVDVEGVKHNVIGIHALCDILKISEGSVLNYFYARKENPFTMYISHKRTTIYREPLPVREVVIGGKKIGRPPKDTSGTPEDLAPKPYNPKNKLTWRD